MPPAEPAADTATVRVWDLPTRLFHWGLVAMLAASWWTGDHHQMDWHRRSGYAIVALLVFRLYWGVFGGRTARFVQFVRGPSAVLAYLRTLGQKATDPAPGHNPAGGWSVLLMLAILIVMVTAGLFAVDTDGLESGPLADFVSFDQGRSAAKLHHFVFNLVLAISALHLLAILFYLVRKRTNLITPMITGIRRGVGGADNVRASPLHAAIGVLLGIACAYAIAKGFRFKF